MNSIVQRKKIAKVRRLGFWKKFIEFIDTVSTITLIVYIFILTDKSSDIYENIKHNMHMITTIIISINISTFIVRKIINKLFWDVVTGDCVRYPKDIVKFV